MLSIILVGICFLFLYIYSTRTHNYWKIRNVKYEAPIPILGNLLYVLLQQESIAFLIKRIYKKFDEELYFGMFLFQTPFLVVKSKRIARKILVSNFNDFPNRPTWADEEIDPWATTSLLTIQNPRWKLLRTKLSPVFTSGKLKAMVYHMKKVTDLMPEYVRSRKSEDLDVREFSRRYFIDIVSTCVFGIQPNALADENSYIRRLTARLINVETYKWISSLILYFLCPILIKIGGLQFIEKEAAQQLMAVFEESYKKRLKSNIIINDLMDALHDIKIQETEEDVIKFDEMTLSAQALIFFQGGNEPVSGVLSFCLYELAINSKIQDTLREEILDNLNSESSLSYDALVNMTYLDLVMKGEQWNPKLFHSVMLNHQDKRLKNCLYELLTETLRKYPIIQLMLRLSEKEYTFEETGLKIDPGTNVVIPLLAIHYDPKYYPDPERFDPERFRGNNWKNIKSVYMPFGDGPRKCIGDRFSLMCLKLALSMFLKNFKVSPSDQTQIPIKISTSAFFMSPAKGSIVLRVDEID